MAKKLFYKIGEACKKLDIQPYVLRYWETEFPFLKPSKSKSGQRVYSEDELKIIGRIKELLYEEGYTIAGAKKKLEADLEQGGPQAASEGPVAVPEAPGKANKKPKTKAKPKAKPSAAKASRPNIAAVPEPDPKIEARLAALETGLTKARQQAQGILDLLR